MAKALVFIDIIINIRYFPDIMKTDTPEKIGDRYITLAGDKPYTPLRKAFFQAADFKAGLLAAGLNFAYEGQKSPDMVMPTAMAIATLILNMAISGTMRLAEKYLMQSDFKNSANLCIDTQPDEKTLPTKPDHMQAASIAKLSYAGLSVVSLVIDSYKIATGSSPIDRGFVSFSEYTRIYQGYNRFNKITKGEWVVVDLPPKEKVLEKKESEVPTTGIAQPVPSLNQ